MEDQPDWVTEHKGGRKESLERGGRVGGILTFRLEGLEGSRAGQQQRDTLRVTEFCTEGLCGLGATRQAKENTERIGEDQVLGLSLESLRCLLLEARGKPLGTEIKDNSAAIGN